MALRACAALLSVPLALPVAAGSSAGRGTARAGLQAARLAADAWSDDAQLVWVENDTPVDRDGRAEAWGYLFYSPQHGAMRSYSVRKGVLETAQDHTVTAAAPALDAVWLDSAEVVHEAWEQCGGFCESGCELESLLLVRGVFASGAAWIAVFSNGGDPRLYVVLDAKSAGLVRRWRG